MATYAGLKFFRGHSVHSLHTAKD